MNPILDSGDHKHPQARDLPCYDPIYNRPKRFRQPFSKSPDRSLARHLAYNGDVAAAQRVVLGRRSILALPSSEEAKRGRFAYTAFPAAHFERNGITTVCEVSR